MIIFSNICIRCRRFLGFAPGIVMLFLMASNTAHAASSWNPTLLVNTESFEMLDEGDSTTNIEIRFGQTLNEKLIYDRTNNRFVFTRGLLVGGNLTATGSLSVKKSISGATLRIDGNADIWGALSATGSLKTKSDLTINSDADASDATATFGNVSGNQTLKFLNGAQEFELSKGTRVNGAISGSGTLNIQNNINTRADIKLNADGGAADATLTFGNATSDQTLKFSNANQRFEFSKDVKVTGGVRASGNLSGSTLTVDGNVNIRGQNLAFPNSAGAANQFLKTDGAGGLSWSAPVVGNSSGKILSLHPEYPNAIYTQSGSAAVGTLTYGYDSTNAENFYRWTTSKAAIQDYWTAVRVQVPKNFASWDPFKPLQLRLRTTSTSSASNHINS
ncbi:hypothetical protein HYW84_01070 [Candidatus Peregrinibacteria bacterium]|nr:hypothetical protein [Candidatus Peregrinibacteria bacterium]